MQIQMSFKSIYSFNNIAHTALTSSTKFIFNICSPIFHIIFLGFVMKKIVFFICLIILNGCSQNNKKNDIQALWDGAIIGNQIAWYEKEYSLVPKSKQDSGNLQERTYSTNDCDITIGVNKNGEIVEKLLYVTDQCIITDNSIINYNSSKTTMKDILKGYPDPKVALDCLSCGNAFEPTYQLILDGYHANNWQNVSFGFYSNDGISKWTNYVIDHEGGYGSDNVDTMNFNMNKYAKLAYKMWDNEKPNFVKVYRSN